MVRLVPESGDNAGRSLDLESHDLVCGQENVSHNRVVCDNKSPK